MRKHFLVLAPIRLVSFLTHSLVTESLSLSLSLSLSPPHNFSLSLTHFLFSSHPIVLFFILYRRRELYFKLLKQPERSASALSSALFDSVFPREWALGSLHPSP